MPKPRVLILCTGNSCRSQIGEGWVRHDLGDRVEVFSAGTMPCFVHPRAIEVMAESGVDISEHRSKSVDELWELPFDLVVTVCDAAREACPVFPGTKKTVHRSFEDPVYAGMGEDALPAFRRARDEIRAVLVPLVASELGIEHEEIPGAAPARRKEATMEARSRRKIEVVGPGCSRCKETFRVVSQLVETEKLPFDVEKIESMDRMLELGVLATPAVAVGGKVVFSGRIPKAEEIRALLATV